MRFISIRRRRDRPIVDGAVGSQQPSGAFLCGGESDAKADHDGGVPDARSGCDGADRQDRDLQRCQISPAADRAKPRSVTGSRAPIRCRRRKISAIRTIRSTRKTPRSIARSRAFAAVLSAVADQPLRAASAIPISVAPPNNRLMPTSRPTAQSADPGNPAMMISRDQHDP